MLQKGWRWLKSYLRRLEIIKKQPVPSIPESQGQKRRLQQLSDTEYESKFLQLLSEIDSGWSRGRVKGFLDGNNINQDGLIEWLQRFGARLLESGEPNHELGQRMVQLGELGYGELGETARSIGMELLTRAETAETNVLNPELEETEADVWFNKGVEQYEMGDFENAIISLDKALKIKPDYHEAWLNKGIALFDLGQFSEAIASYDKALVIKPDLHEAWLNRGIALSDLGKFSEAIASLDKALEIKPDDHQAWRNRGIALRYLGQFSEAIASLDKALEIKSDFHEAWNNRGYALRYLGQFSEAIASLDKALEIKPDLHEAWLNKGAALRYLGQFSEAIASYDKALEIKSDYHQACYNRGIALGYLGKFSEAIASYDKALEIKPDLHEAWNNRGIALDNLGQFSEAIAFLDKALEIKPDKHEAWLNRGNAAGQLISYSQFLAFPSAIATRNPTLNQRGYEGKLASFQEGLKYCLQDTHPEGWGMLHHAIGRAHYFQGRFVSYPHSFYHKAIHQYNEALKTLTDTDYPELHLEVLQDLIRVQLVLGETAKADELQRRGTDVLRRLLEKCETTAKKQKLALKFAGFQQLTVDLAVQSGNLCNALLLAEQGKNACLSWLLAGYDDEILSPSYSQMQQLLNPSTAIIYWHLSPYALHTFILTHNAPPCIAINSDTAVERLYEFEKWVLEWNKQYSGDNKGQISDSSEEKKTEKWWSNLQERLRQLRRILNISTIISSIPSKNIQNLILIPHRDLHRFPVHALFNSPFTNEEEFKGVRKNFTITYLPSAQTGIKLLANQQQINYGENARLISIEHPTNALPNLEFAEIESEAICRIFPNHKRISSNDATKEAFKTNLPQKEYNIFHFTGHANHNYHNPKDSYLALADEDKLTLADIYGFDLTQYQLVSLAACETGITANNTITTEYVGLASCFTACGVAQVISTLWTVESAASALLMIQFYERLQAGTSEVVALVEATQWLRNVTNAQLRAWYEAELAKVSSDKPALKRFLSRRLNKLSATQPDKQPYKHPYYWSAFTITGNF
jgi:CHAT domain-containing protein/tetratricopeptide (TPR) repeat protein